MVYFQCMVSYFIYVSFNRHTANSGRRKEFQEGGGGVLNVTEYSSSVKCLLFKPPHPLLSGHLITPRMGSLLMYPFILMLYYVIL